MRGHCPLSRTLRLRAPSEERELEQECPRGACSPEHAERLDDARRDATVSSIGFGVGLVGVAVGTYSLIASRRAPNGTAVAPWIGVSALGARATF